MKTASRRAILAGAATLPALAVPFVTLAPRIGSARELFPNYADDIIEIFDKNPGHAELHFRAMKLEKEVGWLTRRLPDGSRVFHPGYEQICNEAAALEEARPSAADDPLSARRYALALEAARSDVWS